MDDTLNRAIVVGSLVATAIIVYLLVWRPIKDGTLDKDDDA